MSDLSTCTISAAKEIPEKMKKRSNCINHTTPKDPEGDKEADLQATFEELFPRLLEMKSRSANMKPDERKKMAEQVCCPQ